MNTTLTKSQTKSQSKPRTSTRTRILGALSVCVLGGSLIGTASAVAGEPTAHVQQTQVQKAQPQADCGANEVCFWVDNDMPGAPTWRWSPGSGQLNLPPNLHDNVGSFVANAPACFVDTDPAESRAVTVGDYSNAYKADGKFGSRLDIVKPAC